MKALILAAGLGSRLQEHTQDVPKCLVPVHGKPILEYQLEALLRNNIKEIIIVTGYKSEKIKHFLSTHDQFKHLTITYVHNPEYGCSNSSYSLWLARNEVLGMPYLHLNCDIILTPSLITRIIASPHDNLIVLDTKIALHDNMEQVVLQGDKIIKMENSLFEGSVAKAVGAAKLSPPLVNWLINQIKYYLSRGDKNQNYYGMMRQALHHHEVYGMNAGNEILYEINTVEDLHHVSDVLAKIER